MSAGAGADGGAWSDACERDAGASRGASGLVAVGDAAAREIVRRHFHRHAIAFEDANAETAQLPRDGREDFGAIVQRDAERRTR